ncbi:MAG: precorrin-6y C5,15-methyltransferase (decarboxylating) subunit CbiE [Chloroflexi bacterium]|nr:precorrin-6y C5,15-methyltransferase (decarboxylating) subunit CbiE [Chloroflexota bacterium]
MPGIKVHIIGVAPCGAASLTPEAYRLVQQADVVLGGARLLDMFPSVAGEKVAIRNNLDEVADLIRRDFKRKRVVVLASGDPGFYGIAGYLTDKLGRELFDITPNISAMQLAFARIKESWDDAALASVHSRPIEDILSIVRSNRKVGLFTDDTHSPGEIARFLQEQGVENCRAYICQDLGSDREDILATDLYSLKDMEFSPLNIMILVKDNRSKDMPAGRYFGIPDDEFQRQRDGLITKLEVRAVSLARMRLKEDSVVWDVGAGSGAMSIEAAALVRKGSIFAIEKDARAAADIAENIRRFGAGNVIVVRALAPSGLDGLPDPGAIFVGGSGGRLADILQVGCHRLRTGGRVVVNAATLETLQAASAGLKANGFAVEVTLVNAARSKDISGLTRFQAMNPVFIIAGWREGEQAE